MFDLKRANQELKQLNTCIDALEYGLSLSLKTVFKMEEKKRSYVVYEPIKTEDKPNRYLLCLNVKKYCVSSIEINFDDDPKLIVVLFKTHDTWEGRGLTSILICVLIIISQYLNQGGTRKKIYAQAVNPISAYLLLRDNYEGTHVFDYGTGETYPTEYIQRILKHEIPRTEEFDVEIVIDIPTPEKRKNIEIALQRLYRITECEPITLSSFGATVERAGRFKIETIKTNIFDIYKLINTATGKMTYIPEVFKNQLGTNKRVEYIYIQQEDVVVPVDPNRNVPSEIIDALNKQKDKKALTQYEKDTLRGIYNTNNSDFIDTSFEKQVHDLSKRFVPKLNEALKNKCLNMSFSLDFYYNMLDKLQRVTSYSGMNYPGTLLLCLNDDKLRACNASIELLPKDDSTFEINSRTHKQYERRGYNKVLRAAAILIIKELGGTLMTSIGENPISVYQMLKSFGAQIDTTSPENADFINYIFDVSDGKVPPPDIAKRATKRPDDPKTLAEFEEHLAYQNKINRKNGVPEKDFKIYTFVDLETSKDYFKEYLKSITCL
jgi:hypothetical protein